MTHVDVVPDGPLMPTTILGCGKGFMAHRSLSSAVE